MTLPNFDALQVGDALPAFQTEPISRLALALYCGASGDHNPIHVDIDFARTAGQKDVFAHGMLSMAFLGRQVGDRITCRGTVVEKFEADGEKRVRLELATVDADGQTKLSGDAVVALR